MVQGQALYVQELVRPSFGITDAMRHTKERQRWLWNSEME